AHNGFVKLESENMSKSLGNTLWSKDMVQRHEPEALRLYFLGTHYRPPHEFADERVSESAKSLGRLQALVEEADRIGGKVTPKPGPDGGVFDEAAAHRARSEPATADA